jgi:hypothetical protein
MRAQTVPGAIAVATYDDYADAQRAVDFLADNRFPVDRVTIIGLDLRLEERVVGRLTVARAALAGAGTGAWFGLLIGVLLGLFTSEGWLWVVLIGVGAGVLWGAIFGAIAHALTGGRRDFASVSAIRADRYAVLVEPEYADQAVDLLARLGRA